MLLRKGVYPYEYMDDSKMFNEATLPEKGEFYSNLNMQDITDADYMHAKRDFKDFQIKNLCGYHDFYLKIQKNVFKIYHLDPLKLLSAPGLAC